MASIVALAVCDRKVDVKQFEFGSGPQHEGTSRLRAYFGIFSKLDKGSALDIPLSVAAVYGAVKKLE
ncbi:MAG: hypothetical protein DMG13_16195 [Acidobacteria bacterium]|nr:MAG: hypothetical protein DMG13_16195 [Acidobacteriota bacterium]